MRLVQIRPCDAKCCEESPRFPDRRYKKKKKCRFLKDQQCQIMSGERDCPSGESPVWPGRSAQAVFQETCVEWPHNYPGRGTGGCCWQWVDGD